MRATVLAAAVLAAAAAPAAACSYSKSVTAQTAVPTLSAPVPVRVVALRDAWLERLVG